MGCVRSTKAGSATYLRPERKHKGVAVNVPDWGQTDRTSHYTDFDRYSYDTMMLLGVLSIL